MAKTEAAAVNLNVVLVPINLLTTVIAVAVTPSVRVNVVGAAGTVDVSVSNLAVEVVVGFNALLLVMDEPTPLTALTPILVTVVPDVTPAKLTLILFEVKSDPTTTFTPSGISHE